MSITSSIVTYKTSESELKKVQNCLCESSVERIYIVDNSPNDELHQSVNGFNNNVEYIYGQGNVGYGAAHNIAIRKAIEEGANYHIIINPDVYFEKGTIEKLHEYMEVNSDVGLVMPKIINLDKELQYLCKLLPTPIDLIGRRFIPFKSYVAKRNYDYEMRGSEYDKEISVPFLSGCFMFMRIEALQQTGGFDDNFFMYCEDIDLCRRISMSGYRTMYYPEATVTHAHKKESFKNKAMLRAHIKSAIHYFNKWGWIFDSYRDQINKETKKQYTK